MHVASVIVRVVGRVFMGGTHHPNPKRERGASGSCFPRGGPDNLLVRVRCDSDNLIRLSPTANFA